MGHDDLMAKEYVGRCVEAMEPDPEIVVCVANVVHIDEQGALLHRKKELIDISSSMPSERFRAIISKTHWCDAIFGLMRTDTLRQTRLHGAFADSDRVLLAEMALRGRFQQIRDCLFSRREHVLQTTKRYDPWEGQ